MGRSLLARAGGLSVLLVTSCAAPELGPVPFLCNNGQPQCPEGYSCVKEGGAERCVRDGTGSDARRDSPSFLEAGAADASARDRGADRKTGDGAARDQKADKQVADLQVSHDQDVGHWYQVDSVNCPTYCAGLGKTNVASPDGANCASGETRPASASAQGIVYTHGCWPDCTPNAASGAVSVDTHCYVPGVKQDNDDTDRTVGCFCK